MVVSVLRNLFSSASVFVLSLSILTSDSAFSLSILGWDVFECDGVDPAVG